MHEMCFYCIGQGCTTFGPRAKGGRGAEFMCPAERSRF